MFIRWSNLRKYTQNYLLQNNYNIHKHNFVDEINGAHTHSIESLWRSVKEQKIKKIGTDRFMRIIM